MEHALRAPFDGVVSQVSVVAGAPVDLGATLAVVTPHRSTDDQLNDEEGSPP
jgi:multidrug resistance efflux pump